MEYEKIKKLMDDMGESNLTELEIKFPDGIKISMKKEEKEVLVSAPEEVKTKIETVIQSKEEDKSDSIEKEEEGIIISPMVGTFYSKPSPTSEPYVQIGQKVKKGDVLCIIEAMKLMNEIESEFDGEVVEIFVKDGEPVEFGKPLFKLKK